MKIVFLSNFFNHHQKPFSDEMFNLNKDYSFIETDSMNDEQKEMGYLSEQKPAYVKSLIDDEPLCKKLIHEAETIIIGSAPESLIKEKKKNNCLILRYQERPLKLKQTIFRYVYRLVRWNLRTPFWKPIYMLCASAYTSKDYRLFGMFIGKTYKWGYLTSVKKFHSIDEMVKNKERSSILWTSRLISWKHPELAIELAEYLKNEGIHYTLNIIGDGDQKNHLKELISTKKLENMVHLLGVKTTSQVREYMEKSEIFISTSDRREGWGATINESMSSLCAVVADEQIGSVPFLIKNKENGFSYRNKQEMFEIVKMLLKDEERRIDIAKKAYRTMFELWNPKIAAERLLVLIDELSNNAKCDCFVEGPCSRAY